MNSRLLCTVYGDIFRRRAIVSATDVASVIIFPYYPANGRHRRRRKHDSKTSVAQFDRFCCTKLLRYTLTSTLHYYYTAF